MCNSFLRGKQRKYCSTRCKNSDHQSYSAQKKRGLQRKLHLIKELGGKCNMCGYKKNVAALAFHHAHGKEFKLDVRSLSNRKLKPIYDEARKCVLLCHNCYAEAHSPDLDLAKLLIEPTALTTELPPLDSQL